MYANILIMKVYYCFALAIFLSIGNVQAALITPKSIVATPDFMKVENFINLTTKQFEKLSGRKMGIFQRMYFKKLQRVLKRSDYDSQSTIAPYYNAQTGKFKFSPLWFILGLLIGPFAVLFSYTVRYKSKNDQISAWLGFGLFVLWFGFVFIF